MIKFLHAADVHLDSPLRGLESYEGAPVGRIREASRRAFENLVELAIVEEVDFVLLAGDLYDGDWQDYNTGLYLVRQMTRLNDAGIPAFVIAGNHDAHSKMTRKLRMPENVVMLSTEAPESRVLDDLGVAIHGQGFPTQAVTEDLSRHYPLARRGYYNIGLLHTCAGGVEGHGRYAPCTTQGLIAKEYDYWALGHVHSRQMLADSPYIAFPGNVQGRHVRESGPKGCLLVTAEVGRATRVEFCRLDVARWEVCEVPATSADTVEDIADLAAAELARIVDHEDPDRLLAVRIVVQGPSRLHERLHSDPEACLAGVRARASEFGAERLWIEQVKMRTSPLRGDVLAGDGPIEELFTVLDELRSDDQGLGELQGLFADLRQRLPRELLDDLEGPALDDPEWLRGMVDTAEAILRTRLQADLA